MKDHTQAILSALEKMRKKEIANKETWKARAYSNAINAIKNHEGPIAFIEDVKGLKGIGAKTLEKIQEIINTGKLTQAEEYNANPNYKAVIELTKVHGIGPTKAKELVEQHNVKTLEDLRNNTHLLNKKQIMGLRYTDDFELRINRKEMIKHEAFIKKHILNIDNALTVEVVGSYRRGAKDSGDIDVLITGADVENANLLKDIIRHLEKSKYCVDTLALGDKKYLGVCKIKYGRHYRRLDLLITNRNQFPFAQLYFTGDQGFNIDMRNIALSKGYSLSEYGLKAAGNFIHDAFTTEESIFNFLGLAYVAPKDRKANILLIPQK